MRFAHTVGVAVLGLSVLANLTGCAHPAVTTPSSDVSRQPSSDEERSDPSQPFTVWNLARPDGEVSVWTNFSGRSWQKQVESLGEAPERTDAREGTHGSCAIPGMVHVKGMMRTGPAGLPAKRWGDHVEALQNQACDKWISKKFPARCQTFNEAKWKKVVAQLPTQPMEYCIDRYEYPNVHGQNPWVMMTFDDSEKLCQAQGKRVCTDEEWVFACEGEEALPYAYGYERSSESCNADTGWAQFDADKLHVRDSVEAGRELDKLWRGEPSGARKGCRSPFGVYDMTGNIDEWTRTRISDSKYRGAQKGGYWGPVRARCRPATTAHSEGHYFYQQGTRCCSDR